MVDFKENIFVSKYCKMLNLSRNFIYYTPKPASEENIKIMALLDKKNFRRLLLVYKNNSLVAKSRI